MTWEQQLDALARELGVSVGDEPVPGPSPVPISEPDEDRPHEHGVDCCCWPDHCGEPF